MVKLFVCKFWLDGMTTLVTKMANVNGQESFNPQSKYCLITHDDDVMKCNQFPRNWPFVRGIHRLPVNSPHKGQWRGVLMFSLICVWLNGWVNNREAGDLRRYRAHYDVTVMRRHYHRYNVWRSAMPSAYTVSHGWGIFCFGALIGYFCLAGMILSVLGNIKCLCM